MLKKGKKSLSTEKWKKLPHYINSLQLILPYLLTYSMQQSPS